MQTNRSDNVQRIRYRDVGYSREERHEEVDPGHGVGEGLFDLLFLESLVLDTLVIFPDTLNEEDLVGLREAVSSGGAVGEDEPHGDWGAGRNASAAKVGPIVG